MSSLVHRLALANNIVGKEKNLYNALYKSMWNGCGKLEEIKAISEDNNLWLAVKLVFSDDTIHEGDAFLFDVFEQIYAKLMWMCYLEMYMRNKGDTPFPPPTE